METVGFVFCVGGQIDHRDPVCALSNECIQLYLAVEKLVYVLGFIDEHALGYHTFHTAPLYQLCVAVTACRNPSSISVSLAFSISLPAYLG